MTTDISSNPADAAGTGIENTSSNAVDTSVVNENTPIAGDPAAATAAAGNASSGLPPAQVPVVGADGKVAYVPNYKYKAAMQEKELDSFWHPLVKDVESEKKVKDLFTKVDAFDFIREKKDTVEGKFNSLLGDYNHLDGTVTKFNTAVKNGDLSSAFRQAGISKEQIFKWTQSQLALLEMPPEQRAQFEQFETTRQQKSELEEQFQSMQQQFQDQAVQNRTMQLDFALTRPEVAKFADAWDRNSEQPGAFRDLVIEEAKKIVYESQMAGKPVDVSPEQAIQMTMKRFQRFLNVGETTMQAASQAVPSNNNTGQRQPPPVIPNVTGKASSPIKQVPRSLDDLKKIARQLGHS